MNNPREITIQPLISYPRQAEVGKSYLMTIDIELLGEDWPYEEEEVALYCLLDTEPLFTHEPIGEPAIVLNRFGGSYGEAMFTLKAQNEVGEGEISVRLLHQGMPVRRILLTDISVQSTLYSHPLRPDKKEDWFVLLAEILTLEDIQDVCFEIDIKFDEISGQDTPLDITIARLLMIVEQRDLQDTFYRILKRIQPLVPLETFSVPLVEILATVPQETQDMAFAQFTEIRESTDVWKTPLFKWLEEAFNLAEIKELCIQLELESEITWLDTVLSTAIIRFLRLISRRQMEIILYEKLLRLRPFRINELQQVFSQYQDDTFILPLVRLVQQFRGEHKRAVTAIAIHDNCLITGGQDGHLVFWDISDGSVIYSPSLIPNRAISSLSVWSNGAILAEAGLDNYLQLWQLKPDITSIQTLPINSPLLSVDYHPHLEQLIMGTLDGRLDVIDTQTYSPIWGRAIHEGQINYVFYSPDGEKVIACSNDKAVSVLDSTNGDSLHRLFAHTEVINDASISSDSSYMATAGADNTVRVWDFEIGTVVFIITDHPAEVTSVICHPQLPFIISASYNGLILFHHIETGQLLYNFASGLSGYLKLLLMPDGTDLIVAGEGLDEVFRCNLTPFIDNLPFIEFLFDKFQSINMLEQLTRHVLLLDKFPQRVDTDRSIIFTIAEYIATQDKKLELLNILAEEWPEFQDELLDFGWQDDNHIGWVEEDISIQVKSRIVLFQEIDQILRRLDEEEFRVFCLLYYPDVAQNITIGMVRGHMERLLKDSAERGKGLATLLTYLQIYFNVPDTLQTQPQPTTNKGLSPEITQRLRHTLLKCGRVDRTLFLDDRITIWHNEVNFSGSPFYVANRLISFLFNKYHTEYQEYALILLLEVIKDTYYGSTDACFTQLSEAIDLLKAHYYDVKPKETQQLPTVTQHDRSRYDREFIARLTDMIVNNFDSGELEHLLYRLSIDYNELHGRHSDKVRDLVKYFQRRNQLEQLLEKLSNMRPLVQWPFPNTKMKIPDQYTKYEEALEELIQKLLQLESPTKEISIGLAINLQGQLLAIINNKYRPYGESSDGKAEFSEINSKLNLLALEYLGITFNELVYS